MNDLPVSAWFSCQLIGGMLLCLFVPQVGRSVDETLRLVQAFQYTDHKGVGTSGIRNSSK